MQDSLTAGGKDQVHLVGADRGPIVEKLKRDQWSAAK